MCFARLWRARRNRRAKLGSFVKTAAMAKMRRVLNVLSLIVRN